MIYFTADWHIGHDNIIELVSRPFRTMARMEKYIIRNYNAIVKNDDEVYFVGDYVWGRNLHELERVTKKLNGIKYLILGNHDLMKPFDYIEAGFVQVATHLELSIPIHTSWHDYDEEYIMIHDPAKSVVNREKIFICGHVHDLFLTQKNVMNVGVDVWHFKPVSIDTIKEIIC
jgi:calcineurin-like phosphoesterase family protein